MWHELALTFDSKEKTLENLTLSGVSVGDAAVGRLAKCVSSGGQPAQDLRRIFAMFYRDPADIYPELC